MDKILLEAEGIVKKNYAAAKKSVELKKVHYEANSAISDAVPGYDSKKLNFGSYDRDNFSVMFVDIRNSTKRAKKLGPNNTFLSYHAFYPAVAYIIEQYKGVVLDFTGDGVMAFFGGRFSGEARAISAQNAGLCGLKIQEALDQIVNPLIKNDNILWEFKCGIGIDYGDVIVTKIGTNETYDVKAFGSCINDASKLSSGEGGSVLLSKKVKDLWPSSKNGRISFSQIKLNNDYNGYMINRK
ncbi:MULTISPECIES: adenylate/guanylate cyclase domain-containing protein [Bacillus amyloliquefaciens group]|uniref:adenylate/guanylate cyclase domain-containing protein n=1 Tax=Bacillus amyloliquefaciens group TaxID=1938374 RepID=UPI00021AAF6D|nr:adenylate/guanylate cyclase domain-containing protein [Bacillus amyloliquefaciens]AIW35855.1 guanylate cyclase [Bacillus subtilis]AEK89478.1 putative adenylate/guanylate cyclase [Bacillus amyloliquefaciens XH7]MEC1831860.1 adenylate/guanylate cyclase domain-containing protein [Bacillus amyloliquefaciens]MEC1835646.1 adenylate/guanylate cyclase domain-containing protein [Bacillus amyloliquefaciens]MEC1844362.1 adenylate/guanylate cyclase domain-containing protein [Bacillus amyloliquefaciens]